MGDVNVSSGEQRALPHEPFVADGTVMREFTWSAVVAGCFLGIVFGASSLYLVLRTGITVSASIPVAVLSITLFRGLSRLLGVRKATILENNVVQTAGSAGESIAFGVGVTMPALMLIGFELAWERVLLVAVLGGILGILMMIPLRRAFIVNLHGRLLYPEGTACATVLRTGEAGGAGGTTVFFGFGIAFLHKFITNGMGLLKDVVAQPLPWFNRAAVVSSEMASELLGVGYIIGVRTSSIMMAGAVLSYLILMPTIAVFGDSAAHAVRPATDTIGKMGPDELWGNYIRYIGAGAVASAGIISMLKTLPMIIRSMHSGLASVVGGSSGATNRDQRTERDLPMTFVLAGSIALLVALAFFLQGDVGWAKAILGASLVLVFGFLFVTVSSRLTGEIGSSSNPISGMTVATLLLTCLIFLWQGMTSPLEQVLALSIGAVVCIAASNGGTTSQDLKTGFLVGGTPIWQQWAIILGALSSALVIGGFLVAFNESGTVYSSKPQNVPRVTLTADELAKLTEATHNGERFRVWWVTDNSRPEVPPGKYLVDERGQVRFLVDPAITGRLKLRDDGSEVGMKFAAPKTQVMFTVIKGVLGRSFEWSLILIGTMITIMLELSGISSLAFAVGLYLPMDVSAPIFMGGLTRASVDFFLLRRERHSGGGPLDEAAAIAKTETSRGVLLASGYIAGGSLAGVFLAFTQFSEELRENIAAYKYEKVIVATDQTLKAHAAAIARQRAAESTTEKEVGQYAAEIEALNEALVRPFIRVKAGTQLALPNNETLTLQTDRLLPDIAKEALGSERKFQLLIDLNPEKLQASEIVPAGATLKLPKPIAPSVFGFLVLIAILLGIGTRQAPQAQPPLTADG